MVEFADACTRVFRRHAFRRIQGFVCRNCMGVTVLVVTTSRRSGRKRVSVRAWRKHCCVERVCVDLSISRPGERPFTEPTQIGNAINTTTPTKSKNENCCRSRTAVAICAKSLQLSPSIQHCSNVTETHDAPITKSAARSAIMIVAALVFPLTTAGMIDASATRKPSSPRTLRRSSTTAASSWPILQLPERW